MTTVASELVGEFKKRNSEIGEFVSIIINIKLNHLFRFSNGVLEVPKYFYEEYEMMRRSMSDEKLNEMSRHFQKFDARV